MPRDLEKLELPVDLVTWGDVFPVGAFSAGGSLTPAVGLPMAVAEEAAAAMNDVAEIWGLDLRVAARRREESR